MSHSMGLCGKRFEAFEVRGTVIGLSFFTAYQLLPRDNLTYIASEQSSVIVAHMNEAKVYKRWRQIEYKFAKSRTQVLVDLDSLQRDSSLVSGPLDKS